MKYPYMDYPEYKENYPDKTMGDWYKYQQLIEYKNLVALYKEQKENLSLEEREEVKKRTC
ncbi:hypothetical protein [Enterococcus sp. AZ109]|uniref:hypothetical protein n=1 Tax=Enterococcus sp. AZ109 TaxID=2774634 RepID=UPI003F281DAA